MTKPEITPNPDGSITVSAGGTSATMGPNGFSASRDGTTVKRDSDGTLSMSLKELKGIDFHNLLDLVSFELTEDQDGGKTYTFSLRTGAKLVLKNGGPGGFSMSGTGGLSYKFDQKEKRLVLNTWEQSIKRDAED